jgi:hypothetical protein
MQLLRALRNIDLQMITSMETANHKNNKKIPGPKEYLLAEQIFHNLNQGSLFEIYQILETLDGKDEKRAVEQVFIDRYNFNFRTYI